MRRRFRRVVATFAAACLVAGACSGPAAPPGAEAEVYAAVLDAGDVEDRGVPRRQVVVRETSAVLRPVDMEMVERLAVQREKLTGVQPATELAFRRTAREVRRLPAALPTRQPVAWMSSSELDGLLGASGPGRWWSRWRFRGSGGAAVFSPIGFNADSTQALVYHAKACPGGVCSYGEYVLAERRGGAGWWQPAPWTGSPEPSRARTPVTPFSRAWQPR